MRKLIYSLTIAALMLSPVMYAQSHLERSAPVEEPDNAGYDKILLMHSGKTCYVHYSGDNGLAVKVYDASRKMISSTKIGSSRWDANTVKNTTILGTYDINNELVVFLQQQDRKHPVLYRLRINTDDGKLLKEDVLATTRRGNRYIRRDFVNTQMFVVKDKASDCYAVIFYDNLDEEADDALKIMHFDGRHTLLSTARLVSPDKRIKDITYMDATVTGDKSVFLATYYTGSDEESSKIFVSRLDAGHTTLVTKPLDFSEDFKSSHVSMGYNQESKKLQLAVVTYAKTKKAKNIYMSVLAYVDPATLGVADIKEIGNEKISSFARNNLAYEDDFTGLPQTMIITRNNQTLLVKQAITYVIVTTKNGASYIQNTNLGDIGISEVAPNGDEQYGYLVPHHSTAGGETPIMYLDNVDNGAWQNLSTNRLFGTSDQDYIVRYVDGKTNGYFIFNDFQKNIDNPENERLKKRDKKKSKLNAAVVTMRNGNCVKAFLLEKPAGKKSQHACFLSAADHDEKGTFATIEYATAGKESNYRIVWISLD